MCRIMLGKYHNIEINQTSCVCTVTLRRPETANSLSRSLIASLDACLTEAEADPDLRLFVVRGEDVFCAGMDLAETVGANGANDGGAAFFRLLKRLTLSSKITVAVVGGRASGGGVGLAAAMDVVIGTQQAAFTLSEALFGLVPANILPFLARRLGVHRTRYLALTTRVLNATEAHAYGLVDEISENPSESIRRLLLRAGRITNETVKTNKLYVEKLWPITVEMEEAASRQLNGLLRDSGIQAGLRGFVERGVLPSGQSVEMPA
jgi:polyketide biosynthesis enoyl-CoA hydratase PksH